MKYHKLKAGEMTGTYVMESPVTEADILRGFVWLTGGPAAPQAAARRNG